MRRFDIHSASFLNVALHLRPSGPEPSVPGRRIDASMQDLTPYLAYLALSRRALPWKRAIGWWASSAAPIPSLVPTAPLANGTCAATVSIPSAGSKERHG